MRADGFGLSLLVAAPGSVTAAELRQALLDAGAEAPRLAEIGSHAARFDITRATGATPAA